jgi:Ca-activated chloride channel family protein
MVFLWPDMLWLLLATPILVAAYVWLLRRKKKTAFRYASLAMVKTAMGGGARIRRHIPPALFLAALIVMIVSIARPASLITLPSERGTVILAMDVSGSMRATDVDPSRITAAQAAAKAFVAAQPKNTKIGVVAFAATAMLVQSPTLDREDVIKSIDRFQTQRGTAVGSAILVALRTIFPDAPELNQGNDLGFGGPDSRRGIALDDDRKPADKDKPSFEPVAPGSYPSAVIVLLSDGQTNTGADPVEAARKASDRGVRIYTVGFGTTEGAILGLSGRSMRVQLDEETLKKIADMTRGQYFKASSETDLKNIYQAITTQLVMETQKTEITALFSAAAAVLALLSAGLSLLWFSRIA